RLRDPFLRARFLIAGRRREVAKELLQVIARVLDVIRSQLGQADVEQHGRMALQRVRLQERRTRVLVLARVERLDAFVVTLPRDVGDRVIRGARIARVTERARETEASDEKRDAKRRTSAALHKSSGANDTSTPASGDILSPIRSPRFQTLSKRRS